ncbi:DUF3048 domain-containing protein [Kibdelosporangium aridum]|uniref:DUF3048 domain-containing protein n=1 Tax=Kibdelosporangium aridum TaxID=2030 RepID=A0A428ZAV7_KIBAR|nr:DUF3048 domain-containing protein [Kibdelosporangium aridum]RSM85194.1 DUF3048 domain-containing protein [Kibdelosporangium aridum]
MRKHQRTALVIVAVVLAVAGLVALLVLAPWRPDPAPVGQPPPTTASESSEPSASPLPTKSGTLAVKIDNVAAARPQTGLGLADVVYVEPVEGGLTRLVTVYQGQRPTVTGPVRSARQTDVGLLAQYGKPVLAYSGAASHVLPLLRPLVNASPREVPSAYFRDTHRAAPHNLYVHPNRLPVSGTDSDVLVFGPASSLGVPVAHHRIQFAAATYDITWRDGRWLITMDGSPVVSTESGPLTAATIVVQRVVVVGGPHAEDVQGSASPVAVTIGSGPATVLRNGMSYSTTWSRPTAADPTRFTTKDGVAVPMAAGPVWIMLVPR